MKILQSVLRLTPFLVSAFALSNSVSVAELLPEVYQELKAKAPEQLTIKVLSADVTDFVNVVGSVTEGRIKLPSKHICAQAEVTAVNRSESGLKSGSIIEIVYTVEILAKNYATAGGGGGAGEGNSASGVPKTGGLGRNWLRRKLQCSGTRTEF
jgi:hypothetical protein